MGSSHNAVQIRAIQALNTIIIHKNVRKIIEPDLKELLKTIVSVMDNVEYEAVIHCLEAIVREFSYCIGPYSVDLIKRLLV